MTNTINVPRELLENIVLCYNEGEFELGTLAAECHALLSAPSPAGVDGLGVIGYKFTRTFNGETFLSKDGGMFAHHTSEPLCRLSDAAAIIDGLRGEVATLTVESELGLGHYVNMQKERDQQAQRIGELASHLEFAVTMLTVAGLAGNAQVEAMRSALSAGVGGVK